VSTSTLLITNPGSRSGDDDLDELVARFQALGELTFERPETPEDLPRLIREIGPGVDQVVIGGGDGTVNLALDALLEIKRPVGLLPLGTANDLARSLDIPEDLERAFAIILDGKTRQIDISRANDVSFVNAIGMGLGPQMTRQMDSETKSRWGVLAYLVGLIKAFRRQPGFQATIRLNGRENTHHCVQITVANGIHYGGGMTISDDAKLDDGKLDVVIVLHQSRLELLFNADSLRWGQTRNADNIIHRRCKEIEIETDPELEVTADGEFLLNTPVRCTIEHAALEIFAPEEPA
jgi:diacylglycerol kinase (ATP)